MCHVHRLGCTSSNHPGPGPAADSSHLAQIPAATHGWQPAGIPAGTLESAIGILSRYVRAHPAFGGRGGGAAERRSPDSARSPAHQVART